MQRSTSVKAVRVKPGDALGDAVAIPVVQGKNAPRGSLFKTLDRATRGSLTAILGLGDFTGGAEEIQILYPKVKTLPPRVFLVGLGEADKFTPEKARRSGGRLARAVQSLKVKRMTLGGVPSGAGVDVHRATGALVEGFLLGLYKYEDWKTKDAKPVAFRALSVAPEDGAETKRHQRALDRIAAACDGTIFARDLGNRPCNDLTPTTMAQAARELARERGLKCTVLDYKKAETLGMNAFCGVAKGSEEPPAFIILEYSGSSREQAPIVLVGKGLTFDTGGISLKPADNMDHMKFDMCGAAAVLGTLRAVAALKLPLNVLGLIPSVENMPSGKAYKPGDVLKSLSGLTIEVRNTDAEGRLVLADALAYADRFKPAAVIDLATLTGGCVVALGNEAAGLFSNDKDLARRILASGEETGERCWEMPLWDEYKEIVKSEVADVRNATGRNASAVTAACFLYAFAEKHRWAHLDIAGTAYCEKNGAYAPKGATGYGVRLLVDLLEKWPG
jgi:leucyl aminopeptidase